MVYCPFSGNTCASGCSLFDPEKDQCTIESIAESLLAIAASVQQQKSS